ncbi:MAG: YdcF family protein [Clostridia bacterium]|nr:YdcF family protein [Clostridia bacterium]
MEEKDQDVKEEKPSKPAAFLAAILEFFKNKVIKTLLRIRKRYLLTVISLILAIVLVMTAILLLSVSAAVCNKTEDRILTPEMLAAMGGEYDAIVVLGCRVWEDGTMSDMLADRVSVGVDLYRQGFSKTLFMSGDSEDAGEYDEVGTMKNAALAAGIADGSVLTDPYGLSTYDSMIRLRDVYGMKRILIVTQAYHLYRALYVAGKLGMEAYGVSADLRTYSKQFFRELREIPARLKDVYFSLIQPKPEYP